MKLVTIIMLLMSMIWAETMNAKMILSSHIESEEAAKSLYNLEKFFHENDEAAILKKEHHLTLGMELLDKYILVTITKIKSYTVENRLQYLLKEKFPDSFIVPSFSSLEISLIQEHITISNSNTLQKEMQTLTTNMETKQKPFYRSIDVEWLALLLLAFAGLVLVYRSASQLTKIKKLQKEIAKYQLILEDEVDTLGLNRG